MELAATFFYITVSVVTWIVGILIVVILLMIIRTIRIIQETVKKVKSSVTDFDVIKNAIASGISQVVETVIGKKFLKGGGKRG